jgi:hypothetical protein
MRKLPFLCIVQQLHLSLLELNDDKYKEYQHK